MIKNKKTVAIFISSIIILLITSIAIITNLEQYHHKNNNKLSEIKMENNSDKKNNFNSNKGNDNENKQENISEVSTNNPMQNDIENTNTPTNNISTNKPDTNVGNDNPKLPNSEKPDNKPITSEKPDIIPDTTENPNETPVAPPIEKDKNDSKRKAIEKTYGITILYGDEIGDYKPKGITPAKLTDTGDIENYLNRLEGELAKYPSNFFHDFNKKEMPLTIYLIKSANGSFSGFTDYQFMNNIKLTLATDYNFEYTIHHELMHYIDCYLNIVMYPKTPYEEFEALNPTEFQYGNATSNQIYNMGTNPRGAYFISQYGSTNVAEDRAEIFKYMTARAYAPIGCFEANEIIRKKAEVISKQIKTYFPSVTGYAHWDRFIK